MKNIFHKEWEAKIEKEEIVASGIWFYQNEIEYKAYLIKTKWNYTSKDLPLLDEILDIPYCDYISYEISDEGILYHWKFEGPTGVNVSNYFPTYFMARDHINTYGYNYEIKW